MKFRIFFVCGALLALAACAKQPLTSQYWQRVNSSETLLLEGPKANQMMDRDIGRCVVALEELQRLGTVKKPVPVDPDGRVLDPDEYGRSDQIPPNKNALIPDESNFRNMEECMLAKGWERVMHPPHSVKPPPRYSDEEDDD